MVTVIRCAECEYCKDFRRFGNARGSFFCEHPDQHISKVCGNCKFFVQHYGLADERVCIPIFCGDCKAKSGIVKKPSDKGCRLFVMEADEEN